MNTEGKVNNIIRDGFYRLEISVWDLYQTPPFYKENPLRQKERILNYAQNTTPKKVDFSHKINYPPKPTFIEPISPPKPLFVEPDLPPKPTFIEPISPPKPLFVEPDLPPQPALILPDRPIIPDSLTRDQPETPHSYLSKESYLRKISLELHALLSNDPFLQKYYSYSRKCIDKDLFYEYFKLVHNTYGSHNYSHYVKQHSAKYPAVQRIIDGYNEFIELLNNINFNECLQITDTIRGFISENVFFDRINIWKSERNNHDLVKYSILVYKAKAIANIIGLSAHDHVYLATEKNSIKIDSLIENIYNGDRAYDEYVDNHIPNKEQLMFNYNQALNKWHSEQKILKEIYDEEIELWEKNCSHIRNIFDKRIIEWAEEVNSIQHQSKDNYEKQLLNWKNQVCSIQHQSKDNYEKQLLNWKNQVCSIQQNAKKLYNENIKKWECNVKEINDSILVHEHKLLCNKNKYEQGDAIQIEHYNTTLLKSSVCFDYEFDVLTIYKNENKTLFVEYQLPSIEDIPNNKIIKNKLGKYSGNEFNALYDKAIYAIIIRCLMEVFHHDYKNLVSYIVLNGQVKSINKATGKTENRCIASIYVSKSDFIQINPCNVDPKECFRYLKGVCSTKLSTITPIKPIMQIEKSDKRFVESQSVNVDNSTNLASMDWEEFEHLIRELFEKEFSANGGEVKVTQASRDGGVDAIAFDPDPIRGGKIVIQAKRYTNTVGVSAVRDLYGTVMNEGANKGILVTTSDYGADSYEFAKNKPITLLNGGHILYLLEKHGQKARIDIREAKNKLI